MSHPHANCTYRIHNLVEIRLFTQLRLGPDHLNEHKFRHNFAGCMSLWCSCSIKPGIKLHIFLHCRNFLNITRKLFDKKKLLHEILLQLNDESLLTVLIFGINDHVNVQILNSSIAYIINSDRFIDSLI